MLYMPEGVTDTGDFPYSLGIRPLANRSEPHESALDCRATVAHGGLCLLPFSVRVLRRWPDDSCPPASATPEASTGASATGRRTWSWRHPGLLEDFRRVRARNTESIYLPHYAGGHCDVISRHDARRLGASWGDGCPGGPGCSGPWTAGRDSDQEDIRRVRKDPDMLVARLDRGLAGIGVRMDDDGLLDEGNRGCQSSAWAET
jgi:hypothetical protein